LFVAHFAFALDPQQVERRLTDPIDFGLQQLRRRLIDQCGDGGTGCRYAACMNAANSASVSRPAKAHALRVSLAIDRR
jgi:hypothetical protein